VRRVASSATFWKTLPVSFCTSHLATFSSLGDQEGIWVHVVRSYTDEQAHVLLGQLSDSRSFLRSTGPSSRSTCHNSRPLSPILFVDVVRVSHLRAVAGALPNPGRSPRCKQTTNNTPDDRRNTEVECHDVQRHYSCRTGEREHDLGLRSSLPRSLSP
jgi:hypothetical protein